MGIAHVDEDKAVLDVVRETQPPFSPEATVKEFSGLFKAYGVLTVTGDHYSAEFVREAFSKCGIEYKPSELSRSEIYLELLPLISSGRVDLLDNPRLVRQLSGLERRTARSGKDSVDHAPGGHDDCANSAAGALVFALRGAGAVFGLIDYLQAIASGKSSMPDPSPRIEDNPRNTNLLKEERFQAELRLRGIVDQKASVGERPTPPCPKCAATCTVRIGGAGVVCNQCQHQFLENGPPEIPRVTRDDVLSGRVQQRKRFLG
jgi:hypothetical protein